MWQQWYLYIIHSAHIRTVLNYAMPMSLFCLMQDGDGNDEDGSDEDDDVGGLSAAINDPTDRDAQAAAGLYVPPRITPQHYGTVSIPLR